MPRALHHVEALLGLGATLRRSSVHRPAVAVPHRAGERPDQHPQQGHHERQRDKDRQDHPAPPFRWFLAEEERRPAPRRYSGGSTRAAGLWLSRSDLTASASARWSWVWISPTIDRARPEA